MKKLMLSAVALLCTFAALAQTAPKGHHGGGHHGGHHGHHGGHHKVK
ncbi:hypothetical protein [Hymenobacter agri]